MEKITTYFSATTSPMEKNPILIFASIAIPVTIQEKSISTSNDDRLWVHRGAVRNFIFSLGNNLSERKL